MNATYKRIPIPDVMPEPVLGTLKILDGYREETRKTARAVAVCQAAAERFPDLKLTARVFAWNDACLEGSAGRLSDLVPLFRFLKEQGWPPTSEYDDDPEAQKRVWCLDSETGDEGEPLDATIRLEIRFGETAGATCRYEVTGQELTNITELICYDKDGNRVEKPTSLEVPA